MAPIFETTKFFHPSDTLPDNIIDVINLDGFDVITYEGPNGPGRIGAPNKYEKPFHNEVLNTNVAIASAITSYARMRLRFFIDLVGRYCDTDSIVTNKMLPAEYVNNDLGMMKLEFTSVRSGSLILSRCGDHIRNGITP
jgi:hypothetical protein